MSSASGDARCDVLVVGAGPAGAMAAQACAARGMRTLLVERAAMPREKVCGCCLTPAGVRVLEERGLGGVVRDAGTLGTLRLMSGRSEARLTLPAYRVLSRRELDTRLVRAAVEAGAGLMMRTSAVVRADESVMLQVDGDYVRCEAGCVIVADGISGASLREHDGFAWRVSEASHMGLGVTLARGPMEMTRDELVMVVGHDGYVGLVVLPSGEVDVAAAVNPQAVRRAGSGAAWLREVIDGAGGDGGVILSAASSVRGTPLLTRARNRVACGRVLLVGDACGYVEPFTGEGMTWALQTGARVAAFAERMVRGEEVSDAASAWGAEHEKLTAGRHASCRRVAAMVRSPLRHAAVGLARVAPGMASVIARRVLASGERRA